MTCGAIDELRESSKTIDERVIINFPDKNVVIARFRNKTAYVWMGILPLKKRCLGSSLSMRSFDIEEPGSLVPALYATLCTSNVKSNALSFVENCTEMCCTGSSYIMTDHKATLAAEGNGLH